jgi:hypothetical protein
MSELKFFSEPWCQEALRSERVLSEEMVKVFRDPAKFNHVMAFEVTDRPGVAVQGKYVEARIQWWTAENLLPEDEVWAVFKGKLEHYRQAVADGTAAASLVMTGKLRLAKGSMIDAVKNAKAMNALMRHWGTVPTDWDI